MNNVIAIAPNVQKTNAILTELTRAGEGEKRPQVSLFLRRRLLNRYLRDIDGDGDGRRPPTAIRGGPLRGLLGHTAGLPATFSPNAGPLIVTGPLGRWLRRTTRTVEGLFTGLGLSRPAREEALNRLRQDGIVIVIHEPAEMERVKSLMAARGANPIYSGQSRMEFSLPNESAPGEGGHRS